MLMGDFCVGRAFASLECRSCKMFNLLVFNVTEDDWGGSTSDLGLFLAEHPEVISASLDRESMLILSPTRIELMGQYPYGHKFSDDIPDLIRQDLQDAANCLAIGAANAAAIMSRRVIERLAAYLGIEPNRHRMLAATLEELKDQELINERLYRAFKETKDWGNIGAHPSRGEEGINLPEAKRVVEFVFLIVDYISSRKDLHSFTADLKQRRKGK